MKFKDRKDRPKLEHHFKMKEVERTWKKREEPGINKRVGRSSFIEEVQIAHNICKYVTTLL